MTRTITVIGATGVQGGGVVSALLKDGSWKIRGVTRNPESEKAKTLASQGVEVVTADLDDTKSLIKAFEGSSAVYALTNFWEHIFPRGAEEASMIDYKQGVNLANAASATASLEHYIWATLPSGTKGSGGKCPIPHTDKKAEVDVYIRDKFPELAKKTTFLWHGFYITNIAYLPMLQPTLLATSGKHIILRPCPGSTIVPSAGDPGHNTGIFVKAILANPSLTHGRYTSVLTDTLSFDNLFGLWSKVTGKPITTVGCSVDDYNKLWPVAGEEFAKQLAYHTEVPDWTANAEKQLSAEELGITGLINSEEGLKSLTAHWQ